MKARYSMFCLFLLIGCTSDFEDPSTHDLLSDPAHPHWGHDHEVVGEKTRQVDCSTRYIVNAPNAHSQSVPFAGSGGRCLGRAQSGARELGNRIRERFGHLMNLRVDGRGVQIYNCRTVRGGRSLSLHGEGRAVDIFIPTIGGRADNANGDLIANWLVDNAADIGVMAIIWDRTRWRADSNRSRCYTGEHAHHDHIHIELSWAAARQETPFFQRDVEPPMSSERPPMRPAESVPRPQPPQAYPGPRSPPNSEDPVASPRPASPAVVNWLGSPCLNDHQCDFTVDGHTPICLKNHDSGSNLGICTLSCEGYCPDIDGAPMTFCADASSFGFSGGFCVAKAAGQNGGCQDWVGYNRRSVDRNVGSTTALARQAVACLPDWAPASIPATRPDEGVDNDSPDDVIGLCSNPELEPTDHDQPCPGVAENTWRCGCSIRYERPVSQVCRGGAWVSYQLTPRDCSRCAGRYTSGCEP